MSDSVRHLVTLALGLLVASAGAARADVCDDARDLEGKFLARCKTALERCASYRGSAVEPCKQRAVSNARSAQERDRASAARREERDGAGAECRTETYTTTCFELRDRHDRLCKRSVQVRFDSYEEADQQAQADAWRSQLDAFSKYEPEYASFARKHGHCNDVRGVRCTLARDSASACDKAVYVKAWADYVDFFEKTRLVEMKRELDKVKRTRGATVTGFNKTMDRGLREAGHIAAIDREVGWIAVGGSQVQALEAQAKKLHAEVEAIYEKAIASVRCPAPRNRDKVLTATLRGVTVDHLAGLEQRGTGMKETVVQFGLMGPPRTVREASRRLTHEDVPATACVRQVKPSRTACRIFNVTLRRTRPDGSAWGAWAFFSIGGGELMSCKNLR